MDEYPTRTTSDATSPAPSWSPGPVRPVVYAVLGLAAVGLAVTSGTVPGVFLYGVAALVLLVSAVVPLLRRPALEAVDDTLVLAGLRGRREIPRAAVIEVRALPLARLAGRSHVLRIEYVDDTGEQMEIRTRGDLGTDPREVADTLVALGYPAERNRPSSSPGA